MPRIVLCAVLCSAALVLSVATAADWRQFRGNNADGVAPDSDLPLKWTDGENIAWKVPLVGRGLSGPIIVGEKVFITSSSGYNQDKLHVLCLDAKTGKTLWERQFWATGRTMCHPKMCNATPTPASDGKRVFAFFSSNDLACLDLDGNLLWYRGLTYDYPNASNSLGMASSPIVVGDTLVVQVESDAEAFATGIDVETGLHRWKIDRPRAANWTSPSLLRGKQPEHDVVLLQSSKGIEAVEPRTGETRWSFKDGAATIPSLVVSSDTAFVPSNGLAALKQTADGKSIETLWQNNKLSPATSSPLLYEGKIYTSNRAGALACADAATGDIKWQLRVEGPFTSSPVAAAGHLFLFNEKGKGIVVKPGEDAGEIVGTSDLHETILCTPAIANGGLYVRSDGHLWKIAK